MFDLVEKDLDLMVVIGGFNSSNTTHLQEIAVERNIPSYHIDSGDRLLGNNVIAHKPLDGEITTQTHWLPAGKLKIGVTSGASTPTKLLKTSLRKSLPKKPNQRPWSNFFRHR